MPNKLTKTEMESLKALLHKAIRCEQLIVFVPPSMTNTGMASLDSVVSFAENGPAIQLNLEDPIVSAAMNNRFRTPNGEDPAERPS